jgi:ribonuclease BN (tRNA processing enzyme)
MLWTERTRVLIDCGLHPQTLCRDVFRDEIGSPEQLRAVVVSHLHGDHICYSSLAVLAEYGIPVRCHYRNVEELRRRHFKRLSHDAVVVRPFGDRPFRVGEFLFRPVPVPHHPGFPNYGFIISCRPAGIRRKVAVVTDFHDWGGLVDELADADFLFIESNHDPGLLRRFPNPNSRFHLKNEKAAWLLHHVVKRSRALPQAVMFGHLSAERNSRDLVIKAFEAVFSRQEVLGGFELHIADRDRESPVIEIER